MSTNAQRIQFLISQEDGFNRSRLPALYSDFRGLRTTNPEGYAANVAAWRRALGSLVRGGMLPAAASILAPSKRKSFTTTATAARNFFVLTAGQPLLDALQSDRYGRPLALDAVIQEAVNERDLVPLEAFLRAKESIYNRRSWSAWAVGLPWHALSWGLHRLGVIEGNGGGQAQQNAAAGQAVAFSAIQSRGRLAPDQLVVLANVEAAAAAFADKTADARSPFERVWSVTHFKRIFSAAGAVLGADSGLPAGSAIQQPRLSDMDLNVLLAFMSRDKNLVVFDGHVVKLRGQSADPNGQDGIITEEDRAVAQLREVIDSLTHQTNVLSKRIDDLTVSTKEAVLRKNRVSALAALKQKKQTEAALTTRFATLAQLEATAAQIEQASGQIQVVQAMAASADALKSLNAQVGGAEGVEDVVDRLRDQMDAADEINRILVDPTTSASNVIIDETEIDDELAALEKEEERVAEAAAAKVKEAEDRKKEEAQKAEAEETRKRLEAAGIIPDNDKVDQEAKGAQAALEDETTESLRNLSLNTEEPLPAS
ncbi:hypothetical protein Sste5346_001257 [Sporothrix stenoceras]|uniref:Charged multivesicular body protein 7 n=1 Tax=Sporothrix stenoceras TaxID=5173 RepID=A0ABR3ZNP5_9PEZI